MIVSDFHVLSTKWQTAWWNWKNYNTPEIIMMFATPTKKGFGLDEKSS